MGALLREDAVASTARPAFYPGDRLATSTPASPPTGTSWPCSTRAAVEADEHGRPRRGADRRHGNKRPEDSFRLHRSAGALPHRFPAAGRIVGGERGELEGVLERVTAPET